jgi:hypothetical protein
VPNRLSAAGDSARAAKRQEDLNKVTETPNYSDISDILARKAKGQEAASKRSFAEKIAIVEALNARLAPLKAARERRKEDFGEPVSNRG